MANKKVTSSAKIGKKSSKEKSSANLNKLNSKKRSKKNTHADYTAEIINLSKDVDDEINITYDENIDIANTDAIKARIDERRLSNINRNEMSFTNRGNKPDDINQDYINQNKKRGTNQPMTAKGSEEAIITGPVKQQSDDEQQRSSRRKKILIIGVIAALIFLLAFGTRGLIYLNFIMGNDIIVRATATQQDMRLFTGESRDVSFQTTVTTNPFCNAICEYSFQDLTNGKSIDHGDTVLSSRSQMTKHYTLYADKLGDGQDIYRFNVACRSEPTLLCQTEGKASSRSILVTLEYSLNDTERLERESLSEGLSGYTSLAKNFFSTADSLSRTADMLSIESSAIDEANSLIQSIRRAEKVWEEKDMARVKQMTEEIAIKISGLEHTIDDENISIIAAMDVYNARVIDMKDIHSRLADIGSEHFTKDQYASSFNSLADEFNILTGIYMRGNSDERIARLGIALTNLETSLQREALEVGAINEFHSKVLCNLSFCIENNATIAAPQSYVSQNIHSACRERDMLLSHIETIKSGLDIDEWYMCNATSGSNVTSGHLLSITQNEEGEYASCASKEAEFNNTISLQLSILKSNIAAEIISEKSGAAKEAAISMLSDYLIAGQVLLPVLDNRTHIAALFTNEIPERCGLSALPLTELTAHDDYEIHFVIGREIELDIDFTIPSPECCLFEECTDCCIDQSCSDRNYPVMMIHGHSFNKAVAADYSLEAFSLMQHRLEDDGYLNAGAITFYNPSDIPEGVWGMFDAPVAVKASYYFDFYQEMQNYVLIQVKSDNIDTYALRLHEIVTILKARTGKDKVHIVAHSMGGLVVRRYMQIFGDDSIASLTMIGTPNNGITGSVADFCGITGEKLECQDMQRGSLFLNKLARGSTPDIPVFNIIGSGCDMRGMDGDGIVRTEDVNIDFGENIMIEGSCQGLDLLHARMLDVNLHPDVYDVMKSALGINQ